MVMFRRLLWLALFVVVLGIGWKFADVNRDEVRLDYLIGEFTGIRVWALVVTTFLVGAAAGVAVCLFELAHLGMLSRRYRKALGRMEKELHGLRSLPLGPDGAAASSAPPGAKVAPRRPGRGA